MYKEETPLLTVTDVGKPLEAKIEVFPLSKPLSLSICRDVEESESGMETIQNCSSLTR